MSNPFQLIIPLKQHTPIIHFQHDQAGATLRATEVKPKLDKYLIEHVFNSDLSRYARFLVGGKDSKHQALDYKMSIKSTGYKCQIIKKGDRDIPMFFANMGEDYQDRGLAWNDSTQLIIHSLHLELLDLIKQSLGAFFAITNFGMRSTKGFGSFTLLHGAPPPSNAYRFSVNSSDWKVVFRTIDLFYKSIRGGINGAIKPQDGRFVKGFYMKPLIFDYAMQQEIKWEKKVIKERSFINQLGNQQDVHYEDVSDQKKWPLWVSGKKERIVRDMLGLSSDQTWKGYPGGPNGALITKEDADQKIDRFASPIIFKPVKTASGYVVYFMTTPIPDAYLNATFKMAVNRRDIGEVPMWKEFDLDHFLSHYLTEDKLEKAMQYDQHDNWQSTIADLLLSIYSEIENSRI